MKAFEDELTELLEARAERVTVRVAVEESGPERDLGELVVVENVAFGSGASTSAASQKRPSRMMQRILAVAAALIVVAGIVALTRDSTDSNQEVDVASDEEPTEDFVEAAGIGSDLIVWLEPAIEQDQLDAVEEVLKTREVVDAARYVDQADTFAEFQEHWVDSAEILAAVDADQLPTSYRVDLVDDSSSESIADLVRELKGLDGVRDVATGDLVDPESSSVDDAAPIYVLPPDGYDGMELDGRASPAGDVPALEAMVVGRATEFGFTDLVVIERAVARGFLSTTTMEIGGQVVEPFIDGEGLVARQVSDGDWLRFTSFRDDAFLDLVVPATSIEDGRIAFSGRDGFEVVTSAAPGRAVPTSTIVLGAQGPELILTTTAVDAEAVFNAADNSEDAERFDNGSLSGWFGRPSDASTTGGRTSFSWRITDDHVATVVMSGSDEAILAVAAGVRIVDEATWADAVGSASDGEHSGDAGQDSTADPSVELLVDRFTDVAPSEPDQLLVWVESDGEGPLGGIGAGVSETVEALGLEATYRTSEMVEVELEAWIVQQGLDSDLLAGASPEQIPSVYQVTAPDPISVAYSLTPLPGVRSVQIHPAWSSSPLYLLPPNEVSLDGMTGFADRGPRPESSSATAEAFAVGRPTANGFDRLMVAAILPEPEYALEGETLVIGEREILVFDDVGAPNLLVAVEQLGNGRWLHFYVNERSELRPFAEATSVGSDGLEFQPFDEVVEVHRAIDLTPMGRVVGLSPSIGTGQGFSITTNVVGDLGLILLATSTDAVQRVTVRGHTGWSAATPSGPPVDGAPGDALSWWEPTGHMVYVSTSEPGGAVALAETLIAVDETSWRAALPDAVAFD